MAFFSHALKDEDLKRKVYKILGKVCLYYGVSGLQFI